MSVPSPRREAARLVIMHGHFYQPPRENPSTDLIDGQPEAAPDHDWNERIASQCYGPNGSSRILNPTGQIASIRNNYADLSFDFGPTLLVWLEQHRPAIYRRILEADAASRKLRGGAGNAMAQGYNHMILPLADDHDLVTQLRWARADFRHRFGRTPVGLWLPESAIDQRTADAIIEQGFKITILAPEQVARVRPISGGAWQPPASPDTLRPYRLTHSKRPDASLTVFVFHGGLSRAVAFEGLTHNAGRLADALKGTFKSASGVLSVATDGETFGHHQPFSDMCLAALYGLKMGPAGLTPSTPEHAAALVPPQLEMELAKGPDGLGTSWSCAHGVGRWMRDCGCHTGGQEGWNQRWRDPLRRGLADLSTEMKRLYESFASRYFRDPWEARNLYIEVLLEGGSREARMRFLADHMKKTASSSARANLLRLLESQRLCMTMMTSCGWFFSDLSGIEPVGNLRAAARAIELVKDLAAQDLHARLLTHLKKARSNIPAQGDGAEIYTKRVLPSVLDEAGLAARAVLVRLSGNERLAARSFAVHSLHLDTPSTAGVLRGRIEAEDRLTGQRAVYSVEADLASLSVKASPTEGLPRTVKASQMDSDLRASLGESLLAADLRAFDDDCRKTLERAEPTLTRLVAQGLRPAGPILSAAARALESEAEQVLAGTGGSVAVRALTSIFARALTLGVALAPHGATGTLSGWLERAVARIGPSLLAKRYDEAAQAVDEVIAIMDLESDGRVRLYRFDAENRFYDLVVSELPSWVAGRSHAEREQTRSLVARLVDVADRLNLAREILPPKLIEKSARSRS